MKNLIYSGITKSIAFVLCLAAVFAAVYQTSIFCGENDVGALGNTLNFKEDLIYAIHSSYDIEYDDNDNPKLNINKYLASSINDDKICYYVESNGVKIGNTENKKIFEDSKYHYILEIKNGMKTTDSTLDNFSITTIPSDAKFYFALRDDYVSQAISKSNQLSTALDAIVFKVIICLVISLLSFIYLMFVCGRRAEDKEIHLMLIDRMYSELTLMLLIGVCVLGITGCVCIEFMLMDNQATYYLSSFAALAASVSAATAAAAIVLLQSIVRNIKNHTFLKRSIICRFIVWAWKIIKRIFVYIRKLLITLRSEIKIISAKSYGFTIFIILLLAILPAIFNVVGAVISFAAACLFIGKRIQDLDSIKKGVREIKNGSLSYKIGECSCEDYTELAENINEIADGMSVSLNEKLKAERMKTELITNVSHDLKTPLTSIINYTNLLEEMDLSPAEANDYVKIIAKKSNRLKNLTSDLFDISKVQSGSENVDLEALDAGLLINQTMGEFDKEIKESGIDFVVKAESMLITADSKKMSRVMNNLVNNILKYAMKGTRAYISSYTDGGRAVMEFKNISSYEMDFDDEEITERFVRGDKSRSNEGNGLGLAIAKSYTEICGGSFKVKTDGDLFKVIIKFDIAK